LEEQIVFYFALTAGMLVFLSMVSLGSEVRDVAVEGEARVLIKNLQDVVQEVKSSSEGHYAEVGFQLPEKLGAKDYEVRFLPGSVTVTVDSGSFSGGIDVANQETAVGGDLLLFYRRENNWKVFVQVG